MTPPLSFQGKAEHKTKQKYFMEAKNEGYRKGGAKTAELTRIHMDPDSKKNLGLYLDNKLSDTSYPDH